MLTQIVRYGRMLKVDIRSASCDVRARWSVDGSVLRETIQSTCQEVTVDVRVESDSDPELVAKVIRNADAGCFAQSTLKHAVEVRTTLLLNGEPVTVGP